MLSKEVYDNLSIYAEYDSQLGGAQRMTSIISKKLNKPVYLNEKKFDNSLIWDISPIEGVPPTKIVFIPIVDKYQFQELRNRNQIKFCHSGNSLKNFIENPKAKITPWLTHRERVNDYYKSRGFNINLIEGGYIPFDLRLKKNLIKKDFSLFISRIVEDKKPKLAIDFAKKTEFPLIIAGSWEFQDYVSKLKENEGENIKFIPPDSGLGISEKEKRKLLEEARILIHCSDGGLRDYFEYSILDGLSYGCIPLCITSDKKQFEIIEKEKIGKVSSNLYEAKKNLNIILENYELYLKNVYSFMEKFIEDQDKLWQRWESSLEKVVKENF